MSHKIGPTIVVDGGNSLLMTSLQTYLKKSVIRFWINTLTLELQKQELTKERENVPKLQRIMNHKRKYSVLEM